MVPAPLTSNSIGPPIVLPEFQVYGAMFTANNLASGVLNHDDIGLGKTVETIAAMKSVHPSRVRVVLCPAFLKTQWKSEIERFAPGQKVHIVYPKSEPKHVANPNMAEIDWVVAFYLDAEAVLKLCRGRSYVLIIDEIHNVRGYKTQRLDAVTAASRFAAGRVGLTGSPLYNDAARLFPVLDLIQPGNWGTFFEFAGKYASGRDGAFGFETGALTNEAELRERMKVMSFRRTREEVADQLPFEAKYSTIWVDPPINLSIKDAFTSKAGLISHVRALSAAKAPVVTLQIIQDQEAGIPSVTFTWLREQATLINLGSKNQCLIHGGYLAARRLQKIEEYLRACKIYGRTPAVIATLDSLGEGANLQWAKAVNLAALDWTPDKLRQGLGRVLRMGQIGSVPVRIFACKGTADEHYVSVLTRKLKEQFKLDGREEESKLNLFEALGGRATQAVLKSMYERMLDEEKRENT